MHASPFALVAVAALGCFGTIAAFGTARTDNGVSTSAPQRAEMGSIELLATIPLPGPPTGLAVSRRRVGVSLSLAGVAFVPKDGTRIERRVRIDGIATSLETDGSRFWVADLLHARVLQLDESGSTLGTARVGGLPAGIALTGSDVWALGLEEPSITLADRWNQLPTMHLRFGKGELWPGAIASGPQGVWVATGHRTAVTLMDREGYVSLGRVELPGVSLLAATSAGLWVARYGRGPELARIDGSTLAVHPVDLPGERHVTAIDAGSALVVAVRGALSMLDVRTGAVRARCALAPEREITHIAVDGSSIWAVDATHDELLRFALPGLTRAVLDRLASSLVLTEPPLRELVGRLTRPRLVAPAALGPDDSLIAVRLFAS
jgi:hypothetical protein